MKAVIYAGLRNGQRDQAIHAALMSKHVKKVAEEFKLAPNTIRAAAKRIENVTVFDLTLMGGVSRSLSVRLPPTASTRQPWEPTETIAGPSKTSTCPAG